VKIENLSKKGYCLIFCGILALILSCVNYDEDSYTQSNPWDPNGNNFTNNQAPKYIVTSAENTLWYDYDFSAQHGIINFTYYAYDPNEEHDTLTYTVHVGPSPTTLDSVYHGRKTSYLIDSVSFAQKYYYKITATDLYNSSITASGSMTAPAGMPPSRPTDLYASISSYSYVTLQWDPKYDSQGYRLYRSNEIQGEYTLILDTIPQSISNYITHRDYLNDYYLHFYVLASRNQYGQSRSKPVEGRIYYSGLTTPSINSVSNSTYYGSISISWYPTSTSQNPKYYHLYRSDSTSSSGYYHHATIQHPSNSSTIYYYDTVYSNTRCYYKIAVFDTQDRGSRLSSYQYGNFKTLSAPSSFNASDGTYHGYILLSWYNVIGAAKYYIYRSTSSSGTYTLIDSTDTTIYKDSTITDTTTAYYYYTASAVSDNGKEGALSYYNAGYLKAFSYPVNFTASYYLYKSRIALSWEKVPPATGFNIYRSTSNLSSEYVRIATVRDTFHNDTAVSPDSTYYYKITSIKEEFETSQSPYVTGRLLTYPKNLSGSSTSSYNRLTWSIISSSYIQGYVIYRSSDNDTFIPIDSVTSYSINYYNDYDVGSYFYKVSAYSSYEESDAGPSVFCQPVPEVPDSIWAVENIGYVSISWTAGNFADQYYVYRGTSSSNVIRIDSTTDTTYNDTLTTSTKYYYRVRSNNDGGTSDYSDYVKAGALTAPLAPYNFNVAGNVYNILINWAQNTSGSLADAFLIYRSLDSVGTFSKIDSITGTLYYDTVLDTATYYYKVSGYNPAGEGSKTTAKKGKRVPPSYPATITLGSEQYMTHIPLTWTPSTGADGYTVYRNTSSTGTFTSLASTTQQAYNDSTPLPDITYYYKISAYSIVGEGSLSSPKSGKLLWEFPSPPTSVTASQGTKVDTITVSWSTCQNTDEYAVYRDSDTGFTSPELRTTTISTIFHDTVQSDVSYVYRIKAINQIGQSVLSSAYGIGYRKPSAAPLPPENLVADSLPTHINLTWSMPSSGSPAQSYIIYRADSLQGSYDSLTTTTQLQYNDIVPLTWPTYYWYYVASYNIMGESAPSDTVKGTRK